MYRTHNCGALRAGDIGQEVTLSGWVEKSRDLGGMTFVDLRDRYGVTQVVFNMESEPELCEAARKLGREFVVQVQGEVKERESKNANRPTGDIEVIATKLVVLNRSKVPPFTIEDESDGGDELRMKYRYLDIRRAPVKDKLIFRSKVAIETRKYLSDNDFVEIETPYLIKSTPEGARDFVVPSRMNKGQFYALPQSPQTFKQILMVAGMDKYFQMVRCFRDEDLRADRQPEFTQIDCEMSFVSQEEILDTFEGLTKHLFAEVLGVELGNFPRMTYDAAMEKYGTDKPDLRFDMPIFEMTKRVQGYDFAVFDSAEYVGGICLSAYAEELSNKDMKNWTEWVQRPQIGAKGLVYIKHNLDGTIKSTIGKFYSDQVLADWLKEIGAERGDIVFLMSGDKKVALKQLGDLRIELARTYGLIPEKIFKPLWVVDFPLLEWDEETSRFYAMHHPFTSPKQADIARMSATDQETLEGLRADAYDLVINGAEIGGGSIRIHDKTLQSRNFELLGFSEKEAEEQFGFLLGAFDYGAPPHGGIAFGFDRLCAIMSGTHSIRDFIAFPKNNQGRDTMIDAPAAINPTQLEELGLKFIESQD